MTERTDSNEPAATARAHYWLRYRVHLTQEGGGVQREGRVPPGDELAALRRGADREPGSVPSMWPFYTELDERGRLTRRLDAEHQTLVLFAFHQQSQSRSMNFADIGLGTALRRIRRAGEAGDSLDRRVFAAARSETRHGLARRLRSLIPLLRDAQQGLDYESLYREILQWDDAASRQRIRRRWAGAYLAVTPTGGEGAEPDSSAA